MSKQKTIEDQYKKLSPKEHVLHRPGMYIGSTTDAKQKSWIFNEVTGKMERKDITFNPGFVKIFDEIVSNAVDESKRPGATLNVIKININRETGEIIVFDNGGIPVEIHKEEKQYVPEMIFSELAAGSNFNDDEDERTWVGTNGVGSTVTNIFSTKFKVETADGKKKFLQTYTDNSFKRSEPSIKPVKQNYTKITFMPDYEKLNTTLHDGNYLKLIKRVYDIAGTNPNLKVYLNGDLIKIKSFKDYINMFCEEYCYEQNEHWKVGIGPSEGSFKQVSFVNGAETEDPNGSHINYVIWQVIHKIREYIKKKNKVDVKPATIKNHLAVYIDATVINPVYSSQTKEKLITDQSNFGTEIQISDKLIRSVFRSEIIQKILDWVAAKQHAQEQAELRKLNKNQSKLNPRKIVKLSDANEKKDRHKCMLFLSEGDSASKALISAADKKFTGSFPLKGKPLNVRDLAVKKLVNNDEFAWLMTAIGLQLGEEVTDIKQLRYGKIIFMTDADVDGHHICGLLLNMFNQFWPELVDMGCIYRFRTPLVKAFDSKGKLIQEFFTEEEFADWESKNQNKKFTSRYFKGLGGHKTADFKKYLQNLDYYLQPLTVEDAEDRDILGLLFDKSRSNDRKEWLDILD
jgi:DNA topoisomerase-2